MYPARFAHHSLDAFGVVREALRLSDAIAELAVTARSRKRRADRAPRKWRRGEDSSLCLEATMCTPSRRSRTRQRDAAHARALLGHEAHRRGGAFVEGIEVVVG
jgi:hypothetical protein